MNLGIFYERTAADLKGLEQAARAYDTAIRLSPHTVGPRSNLATVLESFIPQRRGVATGPGLMTGKNGNQLRSRSRQLRQQELKLFERDVRQLPKSAPRRARAALQYRYGLSLLLNGKRQKARDALERAARLAPHHPHFLFLLAKLYQEEREFSKARKIAGRLVELRPENRMYQVFLTELPSPNAESP